METFSEFEEFLKRGRNRTERPIANNTRARIVDENTIAIRLHTTDIALLHRQGTAQLFSGGWRTITTKDRILAFTPAKLEQVKGIWYMQRPPNPNDPRPFPYPPSRLIPKPYVPVYPGPEPERNEGEEEWNHYHRITAWRTAKNSADSGRLLLDRFGGYDEWEAAYLSEFRKVREQRKELIAWEERNRVEFFEGIVINSEGYPTGKLRAPKASKIEKEKRRVNKFVAYCISQLEKGNVPMPSGGDCWYCAMIDENGKPLGDSVENSEHLDSHIKEKYVVPSMLINAMREHGYRDAGIGIMLGMEPDENRMGGRHMIKDTVTRSLRAYLYRRLIPELAR